MPSRRPHVAARARLDEFARALESLDVSIRLVASRPSRRATRSATRARMP